MSTWGERFSERIAARYIQHFYVRWKRKKWKDRQALDAFQDVQRKVKYFVGEERAKEMLP